MLAAPRPATPDAPPLSPDAVAGWLSGCLSADAAIRSCAERALAGAEESSAPGYMSSLLDIITAVDAVPEPIRLLAAVCAKNAVGDSPRKLIHTREWAHFPQDEREAVRARVSGALTSEPSRRVASTLALLVANIARFDVPAAWPAICADLAAAGASAPAGLGWPGGEAPCCSTPPLDPAAVRAASGARAALLALKRTAAALSTRRMVVDAPPPGADGLMDMAAVARRVAAARTAQAEALGAALCVLRSAWEGHTRALLAAASAAVSSGEFGPAPPPLPAGWSASADPALVRAGLAAASAHALREVAGALPDWSAAGAAALADLNALADELLEAGTALGAALAAARSAAGSPAAALNPRSAALASALARCYERAVQVATAMLDRSPSDFAPHLPAFLPAYGSALLSLGRADVEAAAAAGGGNLGGPLEDGGEASGPAPLAPRPKTRVALTRFLARALVCPTYRRDWLDGAVRAARSAPARERAERVRAAAEPAAAALDALAAGPGIGATMAALVEGCIALTPAEAAAWAADPEGYAAGADAEASPDADAPRPCAIALLSCLIDRGGGPAAAALLDLAAALQAAPPGDARATLLREATYRSLGECLGQPDLAERLDFGAWWATELRGLLAGGGGGDEAGAAGADPALAFARRALVARAAWLAGVGAVRLSPTAGGCEPAAPGGAWADAVRALVALLPSPDLVVSLAAASALHAALSDAIEDAAAVEGALGGALAPDDQAEDGSPEAEVAARCAAASASAVPAVTGLLTATLPRVHDDELAARLLGATAALFELCGRGAAPALAPLAAALPGVWERAAAAAGAAGAVGGAARLHACLLSVLTHVLRRLGPAAAADPALCGVLWPALAAALDPAHPEADALLEDGLRLFGAALGAAGRAHVAAAAAAAPGGAAAAAAAAPPEDAIPPQLRSLLPRLVALVSPSRAGTGGPERRAAFSLLEAAVLLGGCGALGPATAGAAADAVAGALAHALSAAAALLEADRAAAREEAGEAGGGGEPPQPQPPGAPPPPPPPPPPRRGAAAASARTSASARAAARARRAADGVDAARDALSALGLAQAMLQTDGGAGAAAALRPAAEACVSALAPPPGAPRPPAALADAAASTLARAVLAGPPGFGAALLATDGGGGGGGGPDAAAAPPGARALDGWLRAAGGRSLEEVVGLPAARALGRARRGAAAAALTWLAATTPGGPPPALTADPRRAARLLALAASAVDEAPAMADDVRDLENAAAAAAAASAAWAAGVPPPPGSAGPDGLGGDGDDAVFAARVGRAAADPLRRADAPAGFVAAARALAAGVGADALVAAAADVGGERLAGRVREVVGGGGGGGEQQMQ